MAVKRDRTRAAETSTLFRRLGRQFYWPFVEMAHRLVGSRLWERKWASRELEEVRKGFSNLNHPHRRWLVEQFDAWYPFTSVLEIGCGYGPNLQLLARRFPGVRWVGIDINPLSVREGNALLAELGIDGVQLRVGKADDLSHFPDASVDIVFTDTLLLYIGPDKIRRVISEMKRVSRKALIFVELHKDDEGQDPPGLGFFTPDGWVRDYRKLLKPFFSGSVTLTKIPEAMWPEGRWRDYGYLITVIL